MNTENTTPNTDEQAGGAAPEVVVENQAAAGSYLGNESVTDSSDTTVVDALASTAETIDGGEAA